MNASFYMYDIDIEDYIRSSGFEKCRYYIPTTLDIPEKFKKGKNLLTMEQIRKRIEEGYIIIPFSKSIYLIDLLKYYDLGLKTCFMTSKAFKIFKKVYKEYI